MPSNEFQALRKRGGKDYSPGHQVMYLTPVTLWRGTQQRILDVGFGIGWGLRQMLAAKVIDSYVGFEPDEDSFNYVTREVPLTHKCELHDAAWGDDAASALLRERKFGQVLCIEVIEHVPLDRHLEFLTRIYRALSLSGTLWLSTPDSTKHSHGVRPAAEYDGLLRQAGFADVTIHEEQWTTLYVCQ